MRRTLAILMNFCVIASVCGLCSAQTAAQCTTPAALRYSFSALVNNLAGTFHQTADFDRDGFPDLALLNVNNSQVLIALNDRQGGIRSITTLTTGLQPQQIEVADFDRDAKPDLAIAHQFTTFTLIFRGVGDGTFNALPSVNSPANHNLGLVEAADMNDDGRLDLVLAGRGPGNDSQFVVATGDGQGNFTVPATSNTALVNSQLSELVAEDFNRDGRVDLGFVSGGIRVMLNNGTGGFGAPVFSSFGSLGSGGMVIPADLNRDGRVDLFGTSFGGGLPFFVLGNGSSTFAGVVELNLPAGRNFRTGALGDVNGDAIIDIIANTKDSSGRDFLSTFVGNPAGTYTQVEQEIDDVTTQSASDLHLAVDDFDRDGKDDVFMFSAPPNGTQGRMLLSACGGHTLKPQIDFDGDGQTDVAVFRPSIGTWFILRSSDLALQSIQFGQQGDLPAAADFDGDRKTDVAVFRPSTGTWFIQQSRDGFLGAQFGQSGDTPAAGDYDGDGKADIAVFRPSTGQWFILQSLNGQFRAQAWGTGSDIPVH